MKKYLPALFLLFALLACAVPSSPALQQGQPTITQYIPATQPTEPAVTVQPAINPETAPTAALAAVPAISDPGSLGSPFSSACGGGIPQIWRNASFNAEMPFDYAAEADDRHGYVTFYPPVGCDVAAAGGEVIAPADGELSQFGDNNFAILLPEKFYPSGLEDVLKFIGIQNPDLARISAVQLQFGNYMTSNGASGPVKKGQSIGDIAPTGGEPPQLEYQMIINYDTGDGIHSYIVSPTLFQYDGKPWPCVQGSPYDCEPKANNYK